MVNQTLVSFRDALDIVFANRNRAYGAYALRREYPRNLGKALGLGILFIGAALLLPQVLKAVGRLTPEPPPLDVTAILGPPPDIAATPPPPPPPPVLTPPPPPRSLQRFVPPIVQIDEEVNEEDRKTVEELIKNDDDIGNKDIKVVEEGAPTIQPDFGVPTAIEPPAPPKDDEPVEMFSVNKPPSFPGGERDLLKFLAENIKYPALARENNIQGNVALSFVIGKDGSVTDVAILKDIGGGCGKEAVRVVQAMPKWFPGEANGHTVKVRYTLPVRFKLD